MKRFDGKTVLITGGGGGIGRATSLRMASEGARLFILDRDCEAAERTAGDAEGEGHKVLVADIMDRASLNDALDRIDAVDVLVANAGGSLIGSFDHLDPDNFASEIHRSLNASWDVCHRILPLMVSVGKGAIVFTSSVNGLTYVGNPAYSAAKAGLLQLMRGIAVQYGPKGIRSNAVSPGSVRTGARSWAIREQKDPNVFDKLKKWYPVGRVGKPEDIAAAIAFLAADEAAFVNGANLVVDGGLTAGMGPMIQEFVIEDG